jgi:hypothetical protein
MKPINIFPIEDFLEKSRLAIKTNQKNLVLTQKEYTDLANSLATVMTRLTGQLDQIASNKSEENIQIKMDGGKF